MNEQQRLLRERVLPQFERYDLAVEALIVQAPDQRVFEDKWSPLMQESPPFPVVHNLPWDLEPGGHWGSLDLEWIEDPTQRLERRWIYRSRQAIDRYLNDDRGRRSLNDIEQEAGSLLGPWAYSYGMENFDPLIPRYMQWLWTLADIIITRSQEPNAFPGQRFCGGALLNSSTMECAYIRVPSESIFQLQHADAWALDIDDLARASVYAIELLTSDLTSEERLDDEAKALSLHASTVAGVAQPESQGREQDDFRPARWFYRRTGGNLYGNLLRQTALRQLQKGEDPIGYQPKEGGQWVYSVEAVKRKWPREAPYLDDNAAKRPRPAPQRTQATHTRAHKGTQKG